MILFLAWAYAALSATLHLVPGEMPRVAGARRHPKALRVTEDRKWALQTRPPGDLSPSVPLSGTPGPRFALAGIGAGRRP